MQAQGSQISTETNQEYKAEVEGWLVNLDEAYALSKATGKPILANFTGSDWCGWCIKLKNAVFVTEEFKTWAAQNVILLELDYPRKKQIPEIIRQQNQNLQAAFGIRGYPTVHLFTLDKNEQTNQYNVNLMGTSGYSPDTASFVAKLTGGQK